MPPLKMVNDPKKSDYTCPLIQKHPFVNHFKLPTRKLTETLFFRYMNYHPGQLHPIWSYLLLVFNSSESRSLTIAFTLMPKAMAFFAFAISV